ncbi:Tyrosine aminotransferase [Sarcoptes scabiei]|uniref:Tyrosine aminotransferase n=1 Tax=Sarcoptes scabiei TaxID=52283 RepID=A0A834VEJ4_SARSC|nr:Tyrosine aminotransferase [Sarcoptes scabiei]
MDSAKSISARSNSNPLTNGRSSLSLSSSSPTSSSLSYPMEISEESEYFETKQKDWSIKASPKALATINPIRRIVETMNLQPNKEKSFIPLSIGNNLASDPTLCENFRPCNEIIESLLETIKSSKFHGYQPASGKEESRHAVAEYCQAYGMNVNFKDIILTSGCSHALDMAMSVLAVPGCNMLVPRPGFPLYKTLSAQLEIEIRYYDLMPEQNWQIDLEDLESKIDLNTSAIIYNNPSNPCGSVFPDHHIRKFLEIAERYCLPIIADEIYENIVFSGHKFHAIASLTEEVPILHCSGTTKKFLIPGWRLGWIAINDQKDRFGQEIRTALNSLSQRIIGPNALIQGALINILTKTPERFFNETIECLQRNAHLAYNHLKMIKGLTPIRPAGAFYLMVRIEMEFFPMFHNDLHLVETLVAEESVFCLPGACFEYPGYVRLVLSLETETLQEALNRIENFCRKYFTHVDETVYDLHPHHNDHHKHTHHHHHSHHSSDHHQRRHNHSSNHHRNVHTHDRHHKHHGQRQHHNE